MLLFLLRGGTEQVRPCELVLIAMGFLGPEQELLKQLTLDVDGRSNILAKERGPQDKS